MNIDHDPFSDLQFMESLRVSRKIGLKNLGKIYKHRVPTFFKEFLRRGQVADENKM